MTMKRRKKFWDEGGDQFWPGKPEHMLSMPPLSGISAHDFNSLDITVD
jgi:hypothetical protein